jgi:TfoX/Sxy family transcriptional regulator of competence genes
MAFAKNQTKDRDELRDLVYGWGKVVTRRPFGEAALLRGDKLCFLVLHPGL